MVSLLDVLLTVLHERSNCSAPAWHQYFVRAHYDHNRPKVETLEVHTADIWAEIFSPAARIRAHIPPQDRGLVRSMVKAPCIEEA